MSRIRIKCCDLDLIFDPAIVTLIFNLWSGLDENREVCEVDTWYGRWLEGICVQCHDVTLI